MTPPRRPRPINWILLAIVLVGAAAAFVWIWSDADATRQDKFISSVMAGFLSTLAFVGWLTFLSGLRWRLRLIGLAVLAVVLGGFLVSLRVTGVSGNLVPSFSWRWSEVPDRALGAAVAAPPAVRASLAGLADYSQFLGPRRDGTLPGPALAIDWSQHPPKLLWRQPIGAGWSAFVVAGDIAVTQEQRGAEELVTAYDPASGALLWAHADPARYDNRVAGVGPRATPVIDGGRVYTVGSTGILNCLDLVSGAEHWQRDLLEDAAAQLLEWGASGSPLVAAERVFVTSGGNGGSALLAFDAATGEPVWISGPRKASFSSPALVTLAGVEQVVALHDTSATAHDPATGELLWSVDWPGRNPKVAQPVFLPGDRFLLSSGYGVGAALFAVTRGDDDVFVVERLWKNTRMKAKFTNVVHRDGFAYGLDDGTLACIEIETGRRQWKDGDYGHGQIILVDDVILVQAESGEIALVSATPEGFSELSRYPAIDGKTWNNAALAGRYLFVRNDREAACFELAVKP